MKILVKFYLSIKEKNDEKSPDEFLFWSCVLDTSIEEEIVDYDYLNKENEYKIKDFNSLLLKMEYLKYSEIAIENIINKHQKRPEYFVGLDRTFMTGSPYNNSSALVVTYYQDIFKFVQCLKVFCGFNSDYKLNLLQQNVIELINNLIGIDILKNESTAGALSIYSKLPAFEVDGNYNSAKGERYITIFTNEDLSVYQNLCVQIEIIDNDKILHDTIQNLLPNFKCIFPDNLEDFSQLHVSVLGERKGKNIVSKIYEEKFHLLKSINIGMSIAGGHSKIVQNRYLNNRIEKIDVYDHRNTISNNPKDFFDIELSYKSLLFGKDKKFLESKYFNNTSSGRTTFLDWIRNKLSSAKVIKIVDAYFDNFGLKDFYNCCNNRFELIVVTTKPKTRKKEKNYRSNTKNFLKNISSVFPDCKIYYVPKLHDRYLYIDDDREVKLYSFSNSWNGTVNNFSMFIQEVSLETSLQIYDEINTYIKDDYLQKLPLPITKKKYRTFNKGKKYTRKYIDALSTKLDAVNFKHNIEEIIQIISELFFAHYYGKVKKEFARKIASEYLERIPEKEIHNLIDITIEKLLKEQKKSFDKKNSYMNGELFSWYDTPRKCLKRLSNINMWYDMRSYRLDLDYGLTELLNICFKMYPIYTVDSLLKNEKRICIKKTHQENTILEYHVSEYIIQSLLTEYFPFKGIIPEQTWKFVEKTDSIYIRLFFALSIINEALLLKDENILSFDDIIGCFKRLRLTQDEMAVVLGNMLNIITLRKQSPEKMQNDYYNSIIDYAAKNFFEQGIIDFSFIAFIESFEIKINKFIDFMEILEQHGKKKDVENIDKLFVLYALQTNKNLQNKVCVLFGIEQETMERYFFKDKNDEKELSDIDNKKFISSLSYLGCIFANKLEINNDISEFDKIIFSLSADMTLIFNTKFPAKLTMFYYDLLFLLYTVCYLKNENSGSRRILDFTDWYLPICVNCLPNDFYGLGYKIVGLYTEIIPEEKKKSLLNRLTYLPMRALISSIINEQSAQTIEIYQKYINKYDIDGYDKSIPEENFLTIGITLCIRCINECNSNLRPEILDCITRINEKIKIDIPEEENHILDYGIEYIKTLSNETKKIFVDSMKNKFFPIQARSLLDE